MLSLSTTLSYYKRKEIQEAMVAQCRAKEVAVKYGQGFGKRPNILMYENDVLSHAQKKATSFHISEETWTNPMQLSTGLRRKDLNELRCGWDLVLDVDFPVWEATKIITHALIQQLQEEGVPQEAITCKFSGNKGFHIAVPFEAFPDTYIDDDGEEVLMSDLFPEGVRTIVEYLIDRIDGPKNNFALSEKLVQEISAAKLADMFVIVDAQTGVKVREESVAGNEFHCSNCDWHGRSQEEYMMCPTPSCNSLLQPLFSSQQEQRKTRRKLDLAIDTILISSRHMYRLVYSLHEKSGLASIPVPISHVLSFERESAQPESVTINIPFLNRSIPQGCASQLLIRSMQFKPPGAQERKEFKDVEWQGDAAPEEVFPPPIKKMLGPLRDGRKRALFVLTNFLKSVGWSDEMVEARLREWNDAQEDPLRETVLEGHLRHHKQKGVVLPPNFDNENYYKDLGVLVHDELSERVKNPVQYVRLKLKQKGATTK